MTSMTEANIAYLGLGANLDEPARSIARAIARLIDDGLDLRRRAPLYRSAPLGPPGQPDYVNTAVEVVTTRTPIALLAACKAVEAALGRAPTVRWGPRIIDIDVLLFGDEVFQSDTLTLPHRELHRRRFVLQPLADLVPHKIVPGFGRTVAELIAALGDDGPLTRLP